MKESKIDSDRFGFKVAKTDGEIFRNLSTEKVVKLTDDYGLVIARVNLEDIELINKLESIGFRLKDTQITYKHNLKNHISKPTSLKLRDFKKSDIPILVQMAKDSFNNYGHYFKNNKLDKERCLEVYEDWAYNTCTKKEVADKIIVACKNDKPIGYLSFKIYEEGSLKYAAGGMGAVDPLHRGKSVFPSILQAGLNWSKSKGLDWCEHNVIVNNFPVNRSMNKAGFKPYNPVATMHLTLI